MSALSLSNFSPEEGLLARAVAASNETDYGLKIAVIHHDEAMGALASLALGRAAQSVGLRSFHCAKWSIASLLDSRVLVHAVQAAVVADVIVVSVRAKGEPPACAFGSIPGCRAGLRATAPFWRLLESPANRRPPLLRCRTTSEPSPGVPGWNSWRGMRPGSFRNGSLTPMQPSSRSLRRAERLSLSMRSEARLLFNGALMNSKKLSNKFLATFLLNHTPDFDARGRIQ